MIKQSAINWETVEKYLDNPLRFNGVEFCVDGHKIAVQPVKTKFLTYKLMVFVDGRFKGTMLDDDSLRKRFFRKESKRTMSDKTLLKCGYTKRQLPEARKKVTYSYYSPLFDNVGQLRRVLESNNESVTLSPVSEARVSRYKQLVAA